MTNPTTPRVVQVARRVVVAAVLVRDGRLLAARRSAPAPTAGRWELPGGKVEPGESEEQALRRELLEELGVHVEVVAPVGRPVPLDDGLVLHAWTARLTSGEPEPLQDHDEVRWVGLDEVEDLDWLPGDRPVVQALAARPGRLLHEEGPASTAAP